MSQPRSGARALSLIAPSALSVNSSTDQGGGKRRGELKRPLTRGRFLMHFVRQADSAETLRAFYVTSSSIWPSFS
jgi:hypothetical protein